MPSPDKPIIILGAGLIGLTLAQGLKKHGFNFKVYDRDNSLGERPAGWGITVHWAFAALEACLPPELFAQIPSIQVNPGAIIENPSFKFLDLSTGETRISVPSGPHLRLNRKLLRQLLSTDIEVNWGSRCTGFQIHDDGVTVEFADGSRVEGSMILGVEGKNSLTRRTLLGEGNTQLNELPVAFTGMTLRLPQAKMQPFIDIDPVLWQGTHPGSGYYVFFSMLSTPESNGSVETGDEYYEGQFNMSWLIERNGPLPKPEDQIARVKAAVQADSGFFPMLKEAILGIPDDSKMLNLKLEDWPSKSWPSLGGRVALVGDAAHTMTMYRGEAANHGIYDAAGLIYQLIQWRDIGKPLEQAMKDYQHEVVTRTYEAVFLSRSACLECHDIDTLSASSAIFQVSGFNANVREDRPAFVLESRKVDSGMVNHGLSVTA